MTTHRDVINDIILPMKHMVKLFLRDGCRSKKQGNQAKAGKVLEFGPELEANSQILDRGIFYMRALQYNIVVNVLPK